MQCGVLDRVVNLLEEGIDVGIRIGPLEDSSLVAQPVNSVRRMVVASPEFLQRHGEPKHPKDLLKANCVHFSASAGQWWTFHEMFISYQIAPYLAQNKLKVLLEEFEVPPRAVSIIYPHARLLPARTRVFIEWMKQELKGLRPELNESGG